ncbi:tuftelin isoform X1 [Pongo pygmaeus]|uniref:tuftelin isoform X1 n=1 Tax=Pongo abelii TaxID=9601 RepID=UPI0001D5D637|nr:tuftelin isoform X1 [Pongo abelii]XP_054330036.1 tuftelin isoform X4 [Pongo pygmaeus]XP_054403928.1 tuftelin isoform X1 [Pongo abelii]
MSSPGMTSPQLEKEECVQCVPCSPRTRVALLELYRAMCQGSVDTLRLTLQGELTGDELEHIAQKAGRKTYAMVSGHSAGHSLASELVESHDGHEEIIKVYLKGRSGEKMIHEKNINQLKSEVQYIQEARNCLQKLREDISSKLDRDLGDSLHRQEIQVVLEKPNGFSQSPTALYSSLPEVDTCINEDVESLRKTVQDLLAKLQEAERQHQSDRVAFEVTLSRYQREAEERNVALQREEDRVEQKEAEVGELQRRLLGMETEHQALLAKVREGEVALEELRSNNADCQAEQEKAATLEKEVAGLREKIHHLDDMLKSQQRKVRQMIEQLQNSKAVIQSKDTTIQELKEKIAYLEAENLEMHDRMEHLIEKQISHGNFSTQARAKTENPGSIRISKPPSPKPKPVIRVVET